MCAHAGVKHGRKQLNNLQHEKKGENVVGSRCQTVTNPTHQLVKTCRWMSNSFCFSSIPVWLVWLSHDGACKDCKLFNWTARAQVESHSIWIPMFELLAEPDWTLLGRVTLILFGRFYIFWLLLDLNTCKHKPVVTTLFCTVYLEGLTNATCAASPSIVNVNNWAFEWSKLVRNLRRRRPTHRVSLVKFKTRGNSYDRAIGERPEMISHHQVKKGSGLGHYHCLVTWAACNNHTRQT